MIEDYYKILKISNNSNQDEIKSAFRHLALIYHPDKNNFPNSKDLFIRINEAYQVLSDPEKRKQYDKLYHLTFTSYDTKINPEIIRKERQNIYYWANEGRKQAKEYADLKFREFIKTQDDFFNNNLKADGIPYNFYMHKTIGLTGNIFPYGRIRFRYLTIPIPRSRKSYVIHQMGLAIKILFMFICIMLDPLNNFWINLLVGSTIGGIVVHSMYYILKTKSIFYYARTHPLVKQYLKKKYQAGSHAMLSTTIFAFIYYPCKWLF